MNRIVQARTLAELLAGVDRALEQILEEYPDITREEAIKMFKAAGAF